MIFQKKLSMIIVWKLKMKNKILILLFFGFILSGCAGVSSSGIFGTGVSVAIDPRSLGTQIDDSLMHQRVIYLSS